MQRRLSIPWCSTHKSSSMPKFNLSSICAKTIDCIESTFGTASKGTSPMNFSDLGKMKEMMAQAREMQAQMEQKLAETIVEAETGGGMVKVRMNGKKEVL